MVGAARVENDAQLLSDRIYEFLSAADASDRKLSLLLRSHRTMDVLVSCMNSS